MNKKFITGLCASLAVFAFGAMTVGQASAATLKIAGAKKAEAFLAIYGFPPATNEAEKAIGGGLGRNFGFGQNMLFQASTGKIGKNLRVEVELLGRKMEACDSFIGGTLMSNNTPAKSPLSFTIQFADFQCNKFNGVLTPSYADTSDRPWIAEICGPSAECKPDPNIAQANLVKIEDVSFNVGPGTVTQGTVWGKWRAGSAGKPPCIELTNPPAVAAVEKENLYVTQPVAAIGERFSKVEGEACLVSANNDWYSQGTEKTEPAIELEE